jgi:hypothetical protein
MGDHRVRQRTEPEPPAEQQQAEGRRPETALLVSRWRGRSHARWLGGGITQTATGRMQVKDGLQLVDVRRRSARVQSWAKMTLTHRAGPASASRRQAVVLLAALLLGTVAAAHFTRVSSSDWTLGDGAASAELQFFQGDFAGLIPPGTPEDDVPARVLALVTDTLRVRVGDVTCQLRSRTIAAANEDGWLVKATFGCPGESQRWSVRLGVLELLPPGQTHLARVSVGGAVVERIARSSAPGFEVEDHPSVWAQARRFLFLGVEHIFTGYDHIAFLLALLLLGGRFLDLVKIVTSFTIAHSVTLALAALGVLNPPSRWVESLIALSIVAVAGENLWVLRASAGGTARVASALRHRWRITFAFGLVHGFGFASALRDLNLPRSALVAGLVSFNLGVEVGQVAIVTIAFPLLAWLRTLRGFQPWGPRLLSGAIALFGGLLLLQRIVGQ